MKKILIAMGCLVMLKISAAPILGINFEKNTSTFNDESFNFLNGFLIELYRANDINLKFFTSPNFSNDTKERLLFEKRLKEMEEFLLEEHIPLEIISSEFEVRQPDQKYDLIIQINSQKEKIEKLRTTPGQSKLKNGIALNFMEIDRKAALKTEIQVKEEINEADYQLKSSKTSKNQTIIIRKWVDISISANEPFSEGLSIEFPISQELSKKRTQFFIWNANTKVWEPIGKPMVHKNTNEDGNYFIDLDVTKSGSYSLGEIAPVSKIKATVKAPKDKALLSCNYISTEPFINIPAVIDEKQSSTTVEIPKEYSNGIIQCIVSDVNGNIETIDCQIAKTFKAKMHQFLHPKELKITTK